MLNITFGCLPLKIIEHSPFENMLNSRYEKVELRMGKETIRIYFCLWHISITHTIHRNEDMSTHHVRCKGAGTENAENS